MIDSHCHLDFPDFDADRDQVLARAAESGVMALVDPGTLDRIIGAGIDPLAALADNDSATALEAAGDALVTGPTGTNVCDVTMLLVDG